MRKFGVAAICIIIGAVIGAAWAQGRGPLWTYHNGNTLQGQAPEYRRGFFIGVIDGYLQGHRDRVERGDDGLWLDRCLAAGWTLTRVGREISERFENAVPFYPNPAAAVVLKSLRETCGNG